MQCKAKAMSEIPNFKMKKDAAKFVNYMSMEHHIPARAFAWLAPTNWHPHRVAIKLRKLIFYSF
jgi:hypothetical protein